MSTRVGLNSLLIQLIHMQGGISAEFKHWEKPFGVIRFPSLQYNKFLLFLTYPIVPLPPFPPLSSALSRSVVLISSSYLVGQDVDSLLQVSIFWVQQRRLLALKGAVGVSVLPKLADHGELQKQQEKGIKETWNRTCNNMDVVKTQWREQDIVK